MTKLIVIGDELKQFARQIRQAINPSAEGLAVDIENPLYGESFGYYWALSHPDILIRIGFGPIDEKTAFYSAYYWLLRFSKLYMSQKGPDAGMEQYVFKFLERADLELDWSLIERIYNEVDAELATLEKGIGPEKIRVREK